MKWNTLIIITLSKQTAIMQNKFGAFDLEPIGKKDASRMKEIQLSELICDLIRRKKCNQWLLKTQNFPLDVQFNPTITNFNENFRLLLFIKNAYPPSCFTTWPCLTTNESKSIWRISRALFLEKWRKKFWKVMFLTLSSMYETYFCFVPKTSFI